MSTFAHLTGTPVRSAFLELSQSSYPGGLRQERHGHAPAYFTYVVSGAYSERVSQTVRRVVEGDVLFHPSEEEHEVDFLAPNTRIFRMTPTALMLHSVQLVGASLERATGATAALIALAQRLRMLSGKTSAEAALAIDASACSFVAGLRSPRRAGPAPTPRTSIRSVQDYLDEHFVEGASLADLSILAGCHPITLTRAFRRLTGLSIGAYIRQRKLEFACRLLCSEELPLSVVAASAGFADQAHLTRALRKATGQTPAQIRFKSR